MGAYVNPEKESKEEFLNREGIKALITVDGFEKKPEGSLPVILCNNGVFTAAGIAYSDDEYLAFTGPADPRPKLMFYVDIEKLHSVSPDLKDYMKY